MALLQGREMQNRGRPYLPVKSRANHYVNYVPYAPHNCVSMYLVGGPLF